MRMGRHYPGCNCEGGGAAYLRGIYELCGLIETTIILIFQDMDYGRKMSPPAEGAKIRGYVHTECVLLAYQCLPAPRKLDV